MSILSTISTKVFAGSLAIVGGIGGVSALATTNPQIQTDLTNVKTAITNKDLSAFKSAQTQLINDKASAEIDKVNSTTQDQLNSIADRVTKQQAVQDAIKNNDYNAFKANADTRLLSTVNSQEAFDKLVTAEKTRTEQTTAIDDAIKNNDYSAYTTAVKAIESAAPQNTDTNAPKRPTLTDDQIKSRFDKEEADYKSNGTLPSANQRGFGFGGGDFGGRGGRRGPNGADGDNNTNTTSTSTTSATTDNTTVTSKI